MKALKFLLRFLGILLGLIIILIIVVPLFFKQQILTKVKEEINNNVQAKVEFADVRLTLLRSFPDFTLSLQEFTVSGLNQFEGDTLASLDALDVRVDLMSALKKNVKVEGITLRRPAIHAIVMEDSSANWDIAPTATDTVPEVPDTIAEPVDTTAEPMDFRVSLKEFKIEEASILYEDATSNMKAGLEDFNLLLKGDFGMDYSDLELNTSIAAVNFWMDGMRYLKDAFFSFDAIVGADLENAVYTFKENLLRLNEIEFGFDGEVAMPDEENMDVNVNFATGETSFKSLLSMVPAIYMKDFEELQTAGILKISGKVEGRMNEQITPSANLSLIVSEAMFKYPELPESVDDINIDLQVSYDGVNNDNTRVDLHRFHMELADNPFDVEFHVYTPMSDPSLNGNVRGNIILASLSDAIPLEDIALDGEIIADIAMEGQLSMIEEERYEDFKADGSVVLKDFYFESPDLPDPVTIKQADLQFTPQYLELKQLEVVTGESDLSFTGKLENYIAYAMKDETIRGDFNLTSQNLDVNRFMETSGEPEDPTAAGETTVEGKAVSNEAMDSSAVTAFEVPGNIDFMLNCDLDHILYDKMAIKNLTGKLLIKDKVVHMDNLQMNLLEGRILVDGAYNSQDIDKPSVNMDLDIQKLGIQSAVQSFSMLDTLAPVLKDCRGDITLKLVYVSLLDQQMNPVLESVDGYGRLKSEELQVVDSETFNKIAGLLKIGDKFSNEFKDVDVSFKIKNGRIIVEPFDASAGDISMVMGGSHGIDQTLDYDLQFEIPREYMGSAANKVLEGLLAEAASKGIKVDPGDKIKARVKIVGTTTEPKLSLNLKDNAAEASAGIKDQLKEKAEEEIQKQKEELESKAREEAEAEAQKIIADAEAKAAKIKAEARENADKILADADEEADRLVKKAAKEGMLAKIAAEKAAGELKKKAREQADKVIAEADKQADAIVQEAKEKAAKIENQ